MCEVALKLFIACILLSSGLVHAGGITVATGEFPPWTTEKSAHGGFINRVVAEAFSRQGIQVTFAYMPWKRVETETRLGRYHASSFWFVNQASETDFILSDPISLHKEVFFHLKSRPFPRWQSLADLGGLKIGATLGYTYTGDFWRAVKAGKIKVEFVARDELNAKKVLAGRLDAFPMEEVSGWALLSDLDTFPRGTRDLFMTEQRPLRTTEGRLRFPKRLPGSAILAAKFNAGLHEMKKDGTFDRIYQDMVY